MLLVIVKKMGAEQKNVAGMWRNSTSGAPFLRTRNPAVVGQVLCADYILSVIRQTVLKKTGRGATVPAALKFIPQYAAAAISLCEYSHPRKQKRARCQSSYRRHWDTCNQSIVLRPVCPTRRNGQDITWADNLYTWLLQSSQFYGKYKKLFTLYVVMSIG